MLRTLDYQRRLLDILQLIFREFYNLFECELIRLSRNNRGGGNNQQLFCPGCEEFFDAQYVAHQPILDFSSHKDRCDRKKCDPCNRAQGPANDGHMLNNLGAGTPIEISDLINVRRGFLTKQRGCRKNCETRILESIAGDHSMDIHYSSKLPQSIQYALRGPHAVVHPPGAAKHLRALLARIIDKTFTYVPPPPTPPQQATPTVTKRVMEWFQDLRNAVAHQGYIRRDPNGNSWLRSIPFNNFIWRTDSVADTLINSMAEFFREVAQLSPQFVVSSSVVAMAAEQYTGLKASRASYSAITDRQIKVAGTLPRPRMKAAAVSALREVLDALTEDCTGDIPRAARQEHFAAHVCSNITHIMS
jgi:hypothetical protein